MLKHKSPSVTSTCNKEKCALERRGQETGLQRQETELWPGKGSEDHLSSRWAADDFDPSRHFSSASTAPLFITEPPPSYPVNVTSGVL